MIMKILLSLWIFNSAMFALYQMGAISGNGWIVASIVAFMLSMWRTPPKVDNTTVRRFREGTSRSNIKPDSLVKPPPPPPPPIAQTFRP